MTTLAELIVQAKPSPQEGYGFFVKRAAARGYQLSKATLSNLATKPLKAYPAPETIEALSAGLDVSVEDVILAASRSLGLKVRPGNPAHGAEIYITGDQSQEDVELLEAEVRSVADRSRGVAMDGHGKPGPARGRARGPLKGSGEPSS